MIKACALRLKFFFIVNLHLNFITKSHQHCLYEVCLVLFLIVDFGVNSSVLGGQDD